MSNKAWRLVVAECRELLQIRPSSRPWQLPLAVALALGLPYFVGVHLGHPDYGLIASLGGLVLVYLPQTPLHHRMVALLASVSGMIACYAFGLFSHFLPWLMIPALTVCAVLVTMACRFYRVGIPGSLFFIMAAAIGAYSTIELEQVPLHVGLFALGGVLACVIGFIYSLWILRSHTPAPVQAPEESVGYVVVDSILIGLFVGLSLLLAQVFNLGKTYWVPVSCLAIIQGVSLRAVWSKQIQRIVGTVGGLGLAWLLLSVPMTDWGLGLTMMALVFLIETAVVRHYGLAVVFITPLTILLADAGMFGAGGTAALIQTRFLDTVIGSLVGLLGGICIHSPAIRQRIERCLPALRS